MTFSVGDVVRLKSGGYPMTVEAIRAPEDSAMANRIHCAWHSNEGMAQFASYSENMLIGATTTDMATGKEVPVESAFPHEPITDWRKRRGL